MTIKTDTGLKRCMEKNELNATGDLIKLSPVGFLLESPSMPAATETLDLVVANITGNNNSQPGAYEPTRLRVGRNLSLNYKRDSNGEYTDREIHLDSLLQDRYRLQFLSETVADNKVTFDISTNILACLSQPPVTGQSLTINIGKYDSSVLPTLFNECCGITYKVCYAYSGPDPLDIRFCYTDKLTNTEVNLNIKANSGFIGSAVKLVSSSDLGFVVIPDMVNSTIAIMVLQAGQSNLVSI